MAFRDHQFDGAISIRFFDPTYFNVMLRASALRGPRGNIRKKDIVAAEAWIRAFYRAALQELSRVLVPGGFLLVHTAADNPEFLEMAKDGFRVIPLDRSKSMLLLIKKENASPHPGAQPSDQLEPPAGPGGIVPAMAGNQTGMSLVSGKAIARILRWLRPRMSRYTAERIGDWYERYVSPWESLILGAIQTVIVGGLLVAVFGVRTPPTKWMLFTAFMVHGFVGYIVSVLGFDKLHQWLYRVLWKQPAPRIHGAATRANVVAVLSAALAGYLLYKIPSHHLMLTPVNFIIFVSVVYLFSWAAIHVFHDIHLFTLKDFIVDMRRDLSSLETLAAEKTIDFIAQGRLNAVADQLAGAPARLSANSDDPLSGARIVEKIGVPQLIAAIRDLTLGSAAQSELNPIRTSPLVKKSA